MESIKVFLENFKKIEVYGFILRYSSKATGKYIVPNSFYDGKYLVPSEMYRQITLENGRLIPMNSHIVGSSSILKRLPSKCKIQKGQIINTLTFSFTDDPECINPYFNYILLAYNDGITWRPLYFTDIAQESISTDKKISMTITLPADIEDYIKVINNVNMDEFLGAGLVGTSAQVLNQLTMYR